MVIKPIKPNKLNEAGKVSRALTKEKAERQYYNLMNMNLSNIMLKALLDENLDIDKELEKELDK
tara:strand:- start:129 stop:320 length:192 start_codon:yes stop_codon:yes gene_type:complete